MPALTRRLVGGFLAAAVCACGLAAPAPTATPFPTPTPIPTATLTPTPTATPPPPTPTDLPGGWRLAWSDEFNGRDGSPPDPAVWTHETGGEGWGNHELEYYTDRPANARIDNPTGRDGALVIQALRDKFGGRDYTSARLTTQNGFSFTYGRAEARIQIPYGQGLWPAFWMLPVTGDWPDAGEIDIMENIGREPALIHGTAHGPGYYGANGLSAQYSLKSGAAWSTGYHVYGLEWEPGALRWYADGALYLTLAPSSLPRGSAWVFNRPFFLLLNVAVGGGWPGAPDAKTVFPQTMKVDWVRVYQRVP